MPFPVTIPFAFGARVGNVAAAELDTDYQTLATACNELKALIDAIVTGNVAGTGAIDRLAYWIGTNTIASNGNLRFDVAGSRLEVLSPASMRLPTSTTAGLPPSGFAGRLQYVTDVQRGWWTDIGAAGWVPNPINIQIYGAQADGIADDRAVIQAALDDAAAGARHIAIPAGVYSIGSPGLVVSQRMSLAGAGAGGSIFKRRASGYPLMTVANPYNVYIQGLAFDGNGLTGDMIAIGPTTIPNNPVPGGFSRNTGQIQGCVFYGTPKSAVGTSAYIAVASTSAAGGDPVLFGILDSQFDGGAWQLAISGTCIAPIYMRACFLYNYGRNAIFITGNSAGNSLLAFDSAIISQNPALVNILVENSTQVHWRDSYNEGATIGCDFGGTCTDIRVQDCHATGTIRFNGTFSNVKIYNNEFNGSTPLAVTSFAAGAGPFHWEGNCYGGGASPPLRSTMPTAFIVTGNEGGNFYDTPQSATDVGIVTVGPGGGFVTVAQQDFTVHRAPTGVRVETQLSATANGQATIAGPVRIRAGAPGGELILSPFGDLQTWRIPSGPVVVLPLDCLAGAFTGGTFRVIVEAQETGGGSGAVNFFQERITVTPF